MTKELEAFDILLQHIETEADWSDYEKVKNAHKIVEQALQRLEAIDNANPSEALECLNDIYRNGVFISDYDELGKQHSTNISPETNKSISEQCETIKQALIKAQEQDKVLNIIFEKGLSLVEKDIIKQSENYKQYQIKISWWNYKPFAIPKSKEEFDLLKRYFK